jgi:hypothetical protein
VSRLFIDIYLDEDVYVLVADLFRARGFIAVTTRDAGNLGTSDSNQLSERENWDRSESWRQFRS